jgi:hypothetical protein
MLIRVRFRIQLINFDAGPDPDFYLIRMRIQVTEMMRIRIRIHNTGAVIGWNVRIGGQAAEAAGAGRPGGKGNPEEEGGESGAPCQEFPSSLEIDPSSITVAWHNSYHTRKMCLKWFQMANQNYLNCEKKKKLFCLKCYEIFSSLTIKKILYSMPLMAV